MKGGLGGSRRVTFCERGPSRTLSQMMNIAEGTNQIENNWIKLCGCQKFEFHFDCYLPEEFFLISPLQLIYQQSLLNEPTHMRKS